MAKISLRPHSFRCRRLLWPLALAILAISPLSGGPPHGQEQDDVVNVRVLLSQSGVHPGGAIKAAFLVDISPGWHINGAELDDPFLVATTLLIEEDADIAAEETLFPEAKTARFGYSDGALRVYEGKIVVGAVLKARGGTAPGPKTLIAKFLFQACNDESCLPPKTLQLEVPLRVVPPSEKVDLVNKDVFAKLPFGK